MDDKKIQEKKNAQDILIEIDNLKKYLKQISNSVRSEKIESMISSANKNIQKLQNETEDFYKLTNISIDNIK